MSSNPLEEYSELNANRNVRFYLTGPQPCPYLPNRRERKVFTTLEGKDCDLLNEALTIAGFRRSQNIAYRPACDMCARCVSIRVRAKDFSFSGKFTKILRKNENIIATSCEPIATEERYELLKTYLNTRHLDGGMSDMSGEDFIAMIEEAIPSTQIIDYRLKNDCEMGKKGDLIGACLIDELKDGRSLIYSFFNPNLAAYSLGTYIILDQISAVKQQEKPFVYLGYWIKGARKMEYKTRFKPSEILGPNGWCDFAG